MPQQLSRAEPSQTAVLQAAGPSHSLWLALPPESEPGHPDARRSRRMEERLHISRARLGQGIHQFPARISGVRTLSYMGHPPAKETWERSSSCVSRRKRSGFGDGFVPC